MFWFGHIGIGSAIVTPFLRRKSISTPLVVGTILPDLVDKPLYYGLNAHFSLISGTRTFGHTALFLFLLTGVALFKKSKTLGLLCLGISTHLLIDQVSETLLKQLYPELWALMPPGPRFIQALFYPFLGLRFPISGYSTVLQHVQSSILNPIVIFGEVMGAALLIWQLRIQWQRYKSKKGQARGG